MSMFKKCVLGIYFLTCIYRTQKVVSGAPYDSENAIIVIPFKSSEKEITKIESFKIDGETAVKQLTSRVSAEKILRTLSNVQEFNVLVEGLDAITLGDVYKTAFPNGILNSISEQYLRSPLLHDYSGDYSGAIAKPHVLEVTKSTDSAADNKGDDTNSIASENEIQYDEVNEDDIKDDIQDDNEDLKEEPITDDYVYDQPVEDRFFDDRENVTKADDATATEIDYTRGSKNVNYTPNKIVINKHRNEELSKYGARFRDWIAKFLG